jgi:hypothetical protein
VFENIRPIRCQPELVEGGFNKLRPFIFSYGDDQFILLTNYLDNLPAFKPGLLQPFAAEPDSGENGKPFADSWKIFVADGELSFSGTFCCLWLWMHGTLFCKAKHGRRLRVFNFVRLFVTQQNRCVTGILSEKNVSYFINKN